MMKLPNGYGSVYKLSGKRRKPWGVRKTDGWDIDEETGKVKQLYKNIGYYETKTQALQALAEYNANPYDLDAGKITFAEIYEKWSDEKFPKIAKSNQNGYIASYAVCESLYDMKFIDIKKSHLQGVIDSCGKNYPTLKKLRTLFNQLYKYALENDVAQKNYAEFIDIGKNENKSTRKPFTKAEIQKLWDNVDRMDFIDTVLIMIYTGIRPGELILIETSNIDIENRTMVGGIKTDAGKDRMIPINRKILPLVEKRMDKDNKFFVVNHKMKQMRYWNYYEEKWKRIMEQLEMDHKPHDCRHTFASLMDSAGANKLCIKRIMGHASQDITDKVYTHKDIEELKEAIDLI